MKFQETEVCFRRLKIKQKYFRNINNYFDMMPKTLSWCFLIERGLREMECLHSTTLVNVWTVIMMT